MLNNKLLLILLFVFTSGEEHELIYNDDIVYYDECRITVSPRDYLQPVRAYVQVPKPCNGTLLWTRPNLQLTLTVVNLENDLFTLCFRKKSLADRHVRSIKNVDLNSNQPTNMREINSNSGAVLCATSAGNRLSTIIEAEPLYGGIYLPYAMFNDRHPWTAGPYPGWERSEKYLYGPQEVIPMRQKKIRRTRKRID